MADAFTGPDFLDSLVTKCEADPTLNGYSPTVSVYDYWPSQQEPLTDALILGYRITDDSEWSATGQLRGEDTVRVECAIECLRAGAGRIPARAARQQVRDILQRVHEIVRDDRPVVGEQTIVAKLVSRDMQQYPVEIGDGKTPARVCSVEFVIGYTARTK